jgi:hypothetical protein
VGSRAVLDAVVKRKIPSPVGNRTLEPWITFIIFQYFTSIAPGVIVAPTSEVRAVFLFEKFRGEVGWSGMMPVVSQLFQIR